MSNPEPHLAYMTEKKARLFGIFVFIIKSEGRFYVAAIMPPYLVYYWL